MREMKDSGIEWIGQIANTHKLVRLKYIAEILDEYRKPVTAQYRNQNADILYDYYGASGIIDKIDGYTIDDHVMLIGEDGANLKLRNLPLMYEVCGKAWINNHAHILKPMKNVDFYYLFYALESLDINNYITGSAQPKLNQENLKEILIPLPSYGIQRKVASYLDTKCSEIDATAEDIQKEISLLEDYKKSVITEAVTKGLNPDAEMKDSGIEWIGEIPKDWKVIRFKYIAIVKSNLVAPIRYMNYPQIAPDVIEKNTGKIISHRSVEEANVDSWNHLFYKGQILYSKIRPVLNKVVIAPYDGLCSADMYPISAKENVRFLQYIMLSAFFVKQVDLVTRDRIKMPKINQDELGNILLVWTSKEEQQQIADFLDSKCSEIDSLIADKKRQLDILADYKKSLIYEYVTGKKEVPVNE